MKLLADALRLLRIFSEIQRFQKMQGGLDQFVSGKDRAPSSDAFVGKNGNEGVHTVLRLYFVSPSAFRCAAAQAGRFYFGDFHGSIVVLKECVHTLMDAFARIPPSQIKCDPVT